MIRRRTFVKGAAASAAALTAVGPRSATAAHHGKAAALDRFDGAHGVFPGDRWEGMNLGYWREGDGGLHRVTRAMGDRARITGFPYHYKTHTERGEGTGEMPVDYDPSQPLGIMWSRKARMDGAVECRLEFTVAATTLPMREGDDPAWRMYQGFWGLAGLVVGGSSQFEGHFPVQDASPMLCVRANGEFGLMRHSAAERYAVREARDTAQEPDPVVPLGEGSTLSTAPLQEGERIVLTLTAQRRSNGGMALDGTMERGGVLNRVSAMMDEGRGLGEHIGIAARGLLDVTVSEFAATGAVRMLDAPVNDCHGCYPLGDTLKQVDGKWQVRFVGMFRSPGDVEIRVSESERPAGGWANVPVAGSSPTITDDVRRDTALIDVTLPFSPASATLYYTVWKDGKDVTGDPRIGTASCGDGTGLVGDVPVSGNYVGRLPRLAPPYRVCGLSCHAITTESRSMLENDGQGPGRRGISAANWVHDQPIHGAYAKLEEFDYQVMLWDDDIWYMELAQYPANTDDAFKIVTLSICGPATRWQMMRHWNVLNGGDHDFGMDDVKGPEQIVMREQDLGQDPEYLQRNFAIESLLMRGQEMPDMTANPRRWRKWTMPLGDFSLLITDARLWRSSQYAVLWDEAGWPHNNALYSRGDPTRTLLGEEQFAWLSETIRTEAAPLICVTGMNCLHSIFDQPGGGFDTHNRVAADYAAWPSAAVDRVLDLMASRGGIVTVGGDVHVGTILEGAANNVIECTFGPIGRWGGRTLKDGFGRSMTDHDGRHVLIHALYHHKVKDLDLTPADGGEQMNWNVLEAVFDTRASDPVATLAIRDIVDGPDDAPRGGDAVQRAASGMGIARSRLPEGLVTLANAEVLILSEEGQPLRGTCTDSRGAIKLTTLAAGPQDVLLVVKAGEEVATVKTRLEAIV